MKDSIRLATLTVLLAVSTGAMATDSGQPPILLGTWQGTYADARSETSDSHAIYAEIFYQKSTDGWDIRGQMRWHVPLAADKDGGPDSDVPEAFTTFDGEIQSDLRTVQLNLAHVTGTIGARLSDAGALSVDLPGTGVLPAVSATLTRIDTHYTPGEQGVVGLDISHHSGAIDWQQLLEGGYGFVYMKASEGVDNPDARFQANWADARSAGLARGAYHFYVTEDDPVQQAELLLGQLGDDPGELPPAVDLEVLGSHTDTRTSAMSDSVRVFLQTVEQRSGVKPVIYTTSDFWDQYYDATFSEYPLWMAEYGVHMPKVPFGWDQWLIWQHRKDVTVPGVEHGADINLLHPSLSLEAITTHGR